ncbi:MAG: DUF4234 domain-containing protein, partial [Sulfurimonas sp.]|uniref:DUF4234 domain-containing protein n=1 Tax=Sulfurimonas sp. TaxID=2022749 RepID=UPI0028CD3DEA
NTQPYFNYLVDKYIIRRKTMTVLELKEKINTKTLNFVLLTMATAGIYPILWLAKNQEIIENLFKSEKSDKKFILYLAICVGLGGSLGSTEIPVLTIIAGLLSLVSWILYLMWAFKIKKSTLDYALNECRINYSMNSFYTAFFTVYYINYCITELTEIMEREKFLKNNAKTSENPQEAL